MNNYESFSHSLVSSKLWLCETLERILDEQLIKSPIVNVLASWDSLLAFMMVVRRPEFYGAFHTYDVEEESVEKSKQLCDHWNYEYPRMYHHTKDINGLNFSSVGKEAVFINCSVDQIDGTSWYDSLPEGSLVCLQCTDLPTTHEGWYIKQSYTIEDFMRTYRMSLFLYCESKKFDYGHLKFNRHMLIGIK